jgi:hypothetical protein
MVVDGSLGVGVGRLPITQAGNTLSLLTNSIYRPIPTGRRLRGEGVRAHREGLDELRKALSVWLETRLALDAEEGGLTATARQMTALDTIALELDTSVVALEANEPAEAVLITLRDALGSCDSLLGLAIG